MPVGLASRASKLDYATRIAEFDHLAQADRNAQLTQFMQDAHQQQTLGVDWFETVCGTARWLLRAAHKPPGSPVSAQLLEPIGMGPDAQRALRSWQLGAEIHDSRADEAMKEVTDAELADCWGYGYYLRTYEMSLPTEGRSELANMSCP